MKKYVILLCTGLLFLFAGCDQTNDAPTYEELALTVVSSEVVFAAAGGEGSIVVDHPKSVTASSSATWCTASVSGQKISVTVPINSDLTSRHALITISDGNQKNFVTVSQSGTSLKLLSNSAIISVLGGQIRFGYECDVPPTVTPPAWIGSSVDHAQRQIILTVAPYTFPNDNRQAVVNVSVGGLAESFSVLQGGCPPYNSFLGTFNMLYATSNVPPANRTRTAPVTIQEAGDGATYYLKGILSAADEALCTLKATYDPLRGLVLLGHVMLIRPGTTNEFWWLPYSQPFNGSNYVSRTESYGMYSGNFNMNGTTLMGFDMVDNGLWSYGLAGFILRNYDGATNLGNVNGLDGQAMYFYPIFQK